MVTLKQSSSNLTAIPVPVPDPVVIQGQSGSTKVATGSNSVVILEHFGSNPVPIRKQIGSNLVVVLKQSSNNPTEIS